MGGYHPSRGFVYWEGGGDSAEGIRKAEIGLCKFVGSYCIALVELDSVN